MSAALDAPGVALDAAHLIALRALAGRAERASRLASVPGAFPAKAKGAGLDLADLRAYAPGDELRHIDRSATARTGRPHVRTFREERDRMVLLVADLRPSMLWGTRRAFASVAACEALALIGWAEAARGARLGLLALGSGPAVAVPFRGRERGMLAAIGGMVRAHRAALDRALEGEGAEPDLAALLAAAPRIAPGGAELVIASGFDGPGALSDRLDELERRRAVRLVRIADGTADLPAGRYPVRRPGGRRLRIDWRRAAAAPGRVAGRAPAEIEAGMGPERMAAALLGPGRP